MKRLERVVIALVVLLFLILIGLVIAGRRTDHGQVEVSILIHKTKPEIFAALIDHDMIKKWVSGIIDLKDLTPGKKGIGSKIQLTERVNESTVLLEEEITFLKPPYLKKYTRIGLGVPWQEFIEYGDYELSTQDDQTLFTIRAQLEYKGFLYQLLEPIITPAIKAKFEADQKQLKRLLEA